MPRYVSIVICCVALLVAATMLAQAPATSVPNLVRYGGALKDAQGAPLASSTVGVTFAIYKQQDGGAPIWLETQNVTSDAAGNYSVLLGSTTAIGLPPDLFSQQEQRWLGVEVQGRPEQARVLLVSVPYAFHAGEAEKFAGHSVSEFVTTDNLQNVVQQQLQQSGSRPTVASGVTNAGAQGQVPIDGATDFIDTTSDQVVLVQQNGTGFGLSATAPSKSAVVGIAGPGGPSSAIAGVQGVSTLNGSYGVFGLATTSSASQPGIGVYGQSNSPNGVGLRGVATGSGNTIGLIGGASSTSGIAVDATETSTSGNTYGLIARITSAAGTGALILNTASGSITGPLITAQTSAGTQFTVDASGNVHAVGKFLGNGSGLSGLTFAQLSGILGSTQLSGLYNASVSLSNVHNTFFGNGAGITGIQFSQLVGQLGSAQFSGSYSNAVTLSNSGNVFAGNGSALTGVVPAAGSPFYVQNGTVQQTGTSFNIDGSGTAGGTLSGNAVNTATNFTLSGTPVLAGGPSNLFVGEGAGQAGPSGSADTFVGNNAGQATTTGGSDTFVGTTAGNMNQSNSNDTFVGAGAGQQSTADNNTFVGYQAGNQTSTGASNVFVGAKAGFNNTTGAGNTYVTSQGPASGTETNTIRIGAGTETAAYMAGIYGAAPAGALPVVINPNGQLGTSSSAGVTSWNGRTGAVVPQSGDYSFGMISGMLQASQVPAGSPNYIQNGSVQQTGSSFNIDGNGTVGGMLSGNAVNTATNFTLSGNAILSAPQTTNLFVGEGTGPQSSAGNNTFVGYQAGFQTSTGASNVFLGSNAGFNNTSGSGNTYITSLGPASGTESNTIRIGAGTETATHIAGIYTVNVDMNGVPVYVDDTGLLGTVVSSRRFKEQIQDMGDSTNPLMKLRPVTFLYKPEYSRGGRTLQYGLIAEEVARVYPELVAYDKDGQPYTVRYQYLTPMLLNEVQKQYRRAEEQDRVIEAQQREIDSLKQQLEVQNVAMQERLRRLEGLLSNQTQTLAATATKP